MERCMAEVEKNSSSTNLGTILGTQKKNFKSRWVEGEWSQYPQKWSKRSNSPLKMSLSMLYLGVLVGGGIRKVGLHLTFFLTIFTSLKGKRSVNKYVSSEGLSIFALGTHVLCF